jgi:hypothetical protein
VYDTRFQVFESFTSGRIQIVSLAVDVIQVPFDDISLRSFMIILPIQERSLRYLDKDLYHLVRFREQSSSKLPYTVFQASSTSISSIASIMAAPQFTPFAEVYSHPHGGVHKAIAGIVPYKSGLTPLLFLFPAGGTAADIRHVQRLEDYQILHLKGRIASTRYTNR